VTPTTSLYSSLVTTGLSYVAKLPTSTEAVKNCVGAVTAVLCYVLSLCISLSICLPLGKRSKQQGRIVGTVGNMLDIWVGWHHFLIKGTLLAGSGTIEGSVWD